ncbi:MAG: metal ABC transporter substrate-binding protein [Demequina sp.]
MPTRTPLIAASAATIALVLAGCTTTDTDTETAPVAASPSASASASAPPATTISVAAAFYPLQFVAERVGGDHTSVMALTSPGVEPHDLELSPASVREIQVVDVVLFLSDFQPAVDDAVSTTGVRALDAHHIVEAHEGEHEDEAHADDEDDHGHDHAGGDPHFWLDPTLLAEYAHDVAAELADIDPANADTYAANAVTLETELLALDDSFTQGLAQCERHDIFVGHEAFGYLTERFDLEQHGLSGLDPDAEPSPARAREMRDLVNATGATTVYSESVVDAAAVRALAADAGVDTAVLDPVEGVTGDDDYIVVMTRNLEALRAGLGCA